MLHLTRRQLFRQCGYGVGKIALASLLTGALRAGQQPGPRNPLAARPPHFAPRARAVIHLFMAGAPSQLELFDHKPALTRLEGRPIPPEVIGGQRYAFIRPDAAGAGAALPLCAARALWCGIVGDAAAPGGRGR